MISLFTDPQSDEATMQLYAILDSLGLPEDITLTINNLEGAKSGLLRQEGRVVDISLANCYTLEDVIRELVGLLRKC